MMNRLRRYSFAANRLGLLMVFYVLPLFTSAQDQVSHNVNLLGQWSGTGITMANDGSYYSDLWGFSVAGRDYAALCSTEGIHLLEVDAEGAINERDFIAGASQGPNIFNRDVFEYNGYLYVICDNGFSTLQIVDLQYLPDSAVVVYDSDVFFQRAHSIFIDTANAKMYVCGPSSNLNGDRPLDVFSIANPISPVYLGSFNYVQYVHDCFVRNDTAWLNCGYEGLKIVNYTNPSAPVIIGDLDGYAESGYNHSGWLSEDGKSYVFTDETAGKKAKFCDVSDLNDIKVLSLFNSGTGAQSMTHNPMLFDQYVFLSHYKDGLQIFDLRDPHAPVRVGWYDTYSGSGFQFAGAWGIFYWKKDGRIMISDMQQGLFVFRFNPPPRIENSEISHGVFPNPLSEQGWFWTSNPRSISYTIRIFDYSGKLVLDDEIFQSNNYAFNATAWSPGCYFYLVQGTDTDIDLRGKFIVTGQ